MTQPTNTDYKSIEEQVEEKSTQILEGARYVTGNQYPEKSEEYKAYQSGFEAALAMVYIELTGTPKTTGKLTQALQERDAIARQEGRDEMQGTCWRYCGMEDCFVCSIIRNLI